ncbi:END3 [Candida oxycetoniae]|uniref:Actin cytoskeleton-regulatory complex protein END3 n=1 Tax=Candida oxycetoniae TaxID=497107 RepID=A0AAI9SYR8_9ASCO|nr:END3 [Candida oxycetoniae]KAI3405646.2 END3 [Candida oxycetoniae]
MPRLEDSEIKKYWEIFQGLKPSDNKISGDKVAPVLKNSRLSQEQLSQIWTLSDIDGDGSLDFEEFCITMRLIFDLVNGSIAQVPSQLPSWLIPSSKAALIQANQAVNSGRNIGMEFDDDDDGLTDDFDWYISPSNKATYETIYQSKNDNFGRIKFDSLNSLYATLNNVPASEISSAWNLVNPKSFETIDKDQTIVFLHILNQRENGKRIPRGVPATLRATFSKEVPNYNLDAQAKPKQTTQTQASKRSFAEEYLNKLGHSSNSNSANEKGTDFSATQGTDWEEVRLRRELADLENLLEKVQSKAKDDKKMDDEERMVKYEFEQLLKYKEEQYQRQVKGSEDANLSQVENDIKDLESQAKSLQEYLETRNQELSRINQEIASLQS